MPFIHPAIFWSGLAAVSLPIIIHLLNRRRFRMREWAAMQFLLDSLRRNRRRLRIEELILLAIRCLVIFLLGAGLARFMGCAPLDILPGAAGTRTTVFILDDSYSMGQKAGGATLFASAATDLAERIETLGSTEQVGILLASKAYRENAFFGLEFVTEKASLVTSLQALKPSDERADLAEAMKAAGKMFDDITGEMRLVVLSDFRKIDLTDDEQATAIGKQFAALEGRGVKVTVLDYGRPVKANLTIRSIELLDKFAIAKVPVRVALTVANHGPERAENVEIELISRAQTESDESTSGYRDVPLPLQTIPSIEAGGVGKVEFQFSPAAPGAMGVVAKLAADELAADNTAHLALEVREGIEVLVVDGMLDAADPIDRDSYYFVHAIDDGKGGYGNRPNVIGTTSLAEANFYDYDLVVLLNVRELPSLLDRSGKLTCPQLASMEQYVRDGGGVAIFTGARISPAFYGSSGPFWKQGSGLLPFPISPRPLDPSGRQPFYRLDPDGLDTQDMLQTFRGEAIVLASLIRFTDFSAADELAAPPAGDVKPPRILARFTDPNASAAIVARQFGKGTVATFYTTAGTSWNDWGKDPVGTYVAAMNDLMSMLARARSQGFSARVGEQIVLSVPDEFRDATAVLQTPAYPAVESASLVIRQEPDGPRQVKFDRPDRAGLYRLELNVPDGSTRRVLFARNVDPVEGNLLPGGKDDIASAFGSEEFAYESHRGDQVVEVAGKSDENEYWLWAIAAVLVLLAAETLLAQRFGHYSDTVDEAK
jgi:hypothetical protein